MATKFLTKNSLKLFCETSYYLRFDGKFYKGTAQAKAGADGKNMEAPTCVDVTVVNSDGSAIANAGETAPTYIIVNKVLQDTITTSFPDNKYVGKSFLIIKHEKTAGKNYNLFDVGVIG
jgi:hypothetical protein